MAYLESLQGGKRILSLAVGSIIRISGRHGFAYMFRSQQKTSIALSSPLIGLSLVKFLPAKGKVEYKRLGSTLRMSEMSSHIKRPLT